MSLLKVLTDLFLKEYLKKLRSMPYNFVKTITPYFKNSFVHFRFSGSPFPLSKNADCFHLNELMSLLISAGLKDCDKVNTRFLQF